MHTCPHDKRAAARVTGPQHTWHTAHLALVQGLGLSLAPKSDLLILGLDLSDDAVQVHIAVIVHGQDDVGVGDSLVRLGQLLQHMGVPAMASLSSEKVAPPWCSGTTQSLRLSVHCIEFKVL